MIPSNFEGWTVGNLTFGGVNGLGIDSATGAINKNPYAFQVPITQLRAGEIPLLTTKPIS